MRWMVAVLVALAAMGFSGVAGASGGFADGHRLGVFLDSLQVEQKWPAGVHVNWQTGEPDGRAETFEGKHTHCSAFVASAAKQLGVYILRPPEHGQTLLANAQADWLASPAGAEHGWFPIDSGYEAQQKANRGFLVVASYKNHSDSKPGHIAIVRPSPKTRAEILAEGPQVIQAGLTNHQSTSLKQGFADHPRAWGGGDGQGEVRYYGHDLP